MEQENILNALNWRYATKKFDTEKKLSENDLKFLLEAARLSPSSFGLQPWKIIVVENKEIREKLKSAAWNQPQVTEASHLLIFLAKKNLTEKDIDEYINLISEERKVSRESLKDFENMLLAFINGANPQILSEWSKKQAYIALGTLLETAALIKIDACPMEGFDSIQFDAILNLEKEGLTSTVLCAIGYRAVDDKAVKYKKVRFPTQKLIITK